MFKTINNNMIIIEVQTVKCFIVIIIFFLLQLLKFHYLITFSIFLLSCRKELFHMSQYHHQKSHTVVCFDDRKLCFFCSLFHFVPIISNYNVYFLFVLIENFLPSNSTSKFSPYKSLISSIFIISLALP